MNCEDPRLMQLQNKLPFLPYNNFFLEKSLYQCFAFLRFDFPKKKNKEMFPLNILDINKTFYLTCLKLYVIKNKCKCFSSQSF